MSTGAPLTIADEVAAALTAGRPVVAPRRNLTLVQSEQ